ncbi:protein of unknown function [Kyrpidia spormannii]|uniref:Uncharacterized protein n=1 Tax=Kyrpidia spormannii TaxID=2055160 RepID=A0A6F9EIF8_9BACL|nr:protein of unknown function [Kyrpidia spormannii]
MRRQGRHLYGDAPRRLPHVPRKPGMVQPFTAQKNAFLPSKAGELCESVRTVDTAALVFAIINTTRKNRP